MAPEGPGPRQFPDTRWSQLAAIGDAQDAGYVERRNAFLARYWTPTYHYIRAMRRLPDQDIEDLTQAFFSMVLRRVDFDRLSPERGSFRGFLKTALRRFVISEDRKRAAAPKPAEVAESAFESGSRSGSGSGEREADPSPDKIFDREWARGLVAESTARLERELGEEGKAVHFAVFRDYCLEPADGITYESLAQKYGIKTTDVDNYMRLVRQRGREVLRRLLKEQLLPGETLDEELRDLRAVFSR